MEHLLIAAYWRLQLEQHSSVLFIWIPSKNPALWRLAVTISGVAKTLRGLGVWLVFGIALDRVCHSVTSKSSASSTNDANEANTCYSENYSVVSVVRLHKCEMWILWFGTIELLSFRATALNPSVFFWAATEYCSAYRIHSYYGGINLLADYSCCDVSLPWYWPVLRSGAHLGVYWVRWGDISTLVTEPDGLGSGLISFYDKRNAVKRQHKILSSRTYFLGEDIVVLLSAIYFQRTKEICPNGS